MGLMNKDWANEQLRFAIRELKDARRPWNQRIALVLTLKDRLSDFGFWYQSWLVGCWIHRLQPRKADSPRKERASFIDSKKVE